MNLQTLSGQVLSPGGAGLQGVTVSVGCASAVSDFGGFFVVSSIGTMPAGLVKVRLDGSTAVPTGPLPYPVLGLPVELPLGAANLSLPRPVVLPDLNSMGSATQPVMLNADGSAPMDLDLSSADFLLHGATGTVVSLDGVPSGAMLDLNLTPVPTAEVPMALPEGVQGGSFVTIQPGNAGFSPALDAHFPNVDDLPVGTEVDIWSFDHEACAWVNRSEESGQRGIVRDFGEGGTLIEALGVISEGGWHTPVLPIDADCATSIVGKVIDYNTSVGVEGVTVLFDGGRSSLTDAEGNFRSPLLPAYDAALLSGQSICAPMDVGYSAILPAGFGGQGSGPLILQAANVVPGGDSLVPPIHVLPGDLGQLAGMVLGETAPGTPVDIVPIGGASGGQSIVPDAEGNFFLSGLAAGSYSASISFLGEPAPLVESFVIEAQRTTSIVLQRAIGSGSDTIQVLVLEDDGLASTPRLPCPGAMVSLQGTDAGSARGLVMMTGPDGMASFSGVRGPFNVTASKDLMLGDSTVFRFATSLVGIEPASNTIGLFLGESDAEFDTPDFDAFVAGAFTNLPDMQAGEVIEVFLIESGRDDFGLQVPIFVNPFTGMFSGLIPSGVGFHLVVVHRDLTRASSVLATLIATDVGQAASGATLNVDLDFANACPWDQPTNFDFNGVLAGNEVSVSMELLDLVNQFAFEVSIFQSSGGPGPVTLNLPDVNAAALGNVRALVRATSSSGDLFDSEDQECRLLRTSNATGVAVDFIQQNTPINPTPGQVIGVAQLPDLLVQFSTGDAGALGDNGINLFNMTYGVGLGTPPPGVDVVFWTVFSPVGVESYSLPPVPLPLFGASYGSLKVQLSNFRIQGTTVDPDQFFSENVDVNLGLVESAFTVECNASSCFFISEQGS